MAEFEKWSNDPNPLLRKMSFMQMATNMNENELQNLRQMFIKIDGDQNGQINADELYDFMSKINLTDKNNNNQSDFSDASANRKLMKVKDIIQETDQNQNNSIDYREFMAVQARRQLFLTPRKKKKNFNMIVQSFNFFDVNDDGVITKDELAQLLKIDNADLSDDVLEYMIQQVDLNNDGQVSFEEFVKMLQVGEDVGQISHGTSGKLLEMQKERKIESQKRQRNKPNDQEGPQSNYAASVLETKLGIRDHPQPSSNQAVPASRPAAPSKMLAHGDDIMQVDMMDQGQQLDSVAAPEGSGYLL